MTDLVATALASPVLTSVPGGALRRWWLHPALRLEARLAKMDVRVLRGSAALGAWFLAATVCAQSTTIEGAVVRVPSGDTIVVSTSGREVEVRLADIGAPQGSQFYAPAARTLLESITADRPVVVTQTGTRESGVFGRVRAGALDVNLELVRRGAAWVCWEYTRDTDYLPYENQAQRARRGVWSNTPEITMLAECRRRPPAERPLYPRN
jgi:endonuclease YncB( thermonuclease family)